MHCSLLHGARFPITLVLPAQQHRQDPCEVSYLFRGVNCNLLTEGRLPPPGRLPRATCWGAQALSALHPACRMVCAHVLLRHRFLCQEASLTRLSHR